MTREEFYQFVKQYVVGMLPEEFSKLSVKVRKAVNQSGEYMGLSLIDESMDVSVAPVFNLDHMYQAFGDMRDELEMLMAVANVIKKNYNVNEVELMHDEVFRLLGNYEEAKERLFITPESLARHNAEPSSLCRYFADIPCNARIQLAPGEESFASIVINENILKGWGKEFEEVFKDAMDNTPNVCRTTIQPMGEALGDLGFPDEMNGEDIDMLLVVSNDKKIDGAANIFLPGVMEEVARRVGGSYFIIPSSVHEVLVHPVIPDVNGTEESVYRLEELIRDVNREAVADDEILSNNAYFYNAETKEFGLAKQQLQKINNLSLLGKDVSLHAEPMDTDEISKNIISGVNNPRQF